VNRVDRRLQSGRVRPHAVQVLLERRIHRVEKPSTIGSVTASFPNFGLVGGGFFGDLLAI
jgi:hypothetical protein